MKLKKRLISMVLMVTLIPMILIVISMGLGIGTLQFEFFEKLDTIKNNTVDTTNSALTNLGEDIIQQKAEDVIGQMDIYLSAHPDKTVTDLQKDTAFQSIAVQTVGNTGYTTVMDADRLINLFHKNPKNVGTDYHNQSKTNPEFYSIISSGTGYVDTFGYYNWEDADGSIKPKYAYYACCKHKTADGVTLRVGATTYIEEFSRPSEEVRSSITRNIVDFEKSMKDSLLLYALLIGIIIIVSSLVSIFIGIRFSERIITPVHHLSQGVENIVKGNLSYRIGEIGGDELGLLARSFDNMAQSLESHNAELEGILSRQKQTNQEIISLIHEVDQGVLTHKITTDGFDGEFRIMVDGINTMLDVILTPLSEAIRVAGEFSHARFSTRFDDRVEVKGEFVSLKTGLNTIGEELSTALSEVSTQVNTLTISSDTASASVDEINTEVHSLAQNSSLISKNAEHTALSVEQILIAMEELTHSVSIVAANVDSVSRLSQDANTNSNRGITQAAAAEEGIHAINEAVSGIGVTIHEMREEMNEIGKIIEIISSIADQTNLLALNAAIEAARAGDAGLGFAVVANEVKSLAQESRISAENIALIISALQKQSERAAESMDLATIQVSKGSVAINDTIHVFQTIAQQVEEISKHMIEIASLSEEEAASVEEITASVSEVKSISDDTARMTVISASATDEAATAGERLTVIIQDLSVIASRINESMSRLNQ